MDKADALIRCDGFEWDEHNSEKIWRKHQVDRMECEQMFFNVPLVAGNDEGHSEKETRFYSLGLSDAGRMLFAVFTVRAGKIRVISARDMNRKERIIYENHKED